MEHRIEKTKFSGISGSTLKIIAITLMFIDHIGASVFERGLLTSPIATYNSDLFRILCNIDFVLRKIGRPSFPIFCFLLVEGFYHTKNVRKYAIRLGLFAMISEIPFDLAFHDSILEFGGQNVFFTLFIGLLVMMAATWIRQKQNKFLLPLVLPAFAAGLLAAHFLNTDYGFKGVVLIVILYLCRFDKYLQAACGSVLISLKFSLTAILAFLPILFYNGKRGISMRYFFYWFYPVHLLLLAAITRIILRFL